MRLKRLRIVVIVVAVLLLFKVVTTTISVVNFVNAVNEGVSLFSTNSTQLSPVVERISSSGGALLAEVQLVALPLRLLGADGCVLANLMEAGRVISKISVDLAPVADVLPSVLHPTSPNRVDIRALREGWDSAKAQTLLDSVRQLRERERCSGASARFERYQSAVEDGFFVLETALALPWDTILRDSAHWLIVLNNSDELRATGGFTTAVIDVRVEDGALTWNIINSYSVDNLDLFYHHPEPPRPMQSVMAIHRWVFRDANWSPDYPTAAQIALRLYMFDQNVQAIDGLITVNMSALSTVVRHLPPLTVDNAPFTQESALDLIREAWNVDAPNFNSDEPERKDFILDFATELAQTISSQIDVVDLVRLGGALREMLIRRDVMIYATAPDLQAYFAERGWDGAMYQTDGDYLMVVDSNLGYNKVTPRIERSIEYQVDLSDFPQATVTLRNTNTNDVDVPCSLIHLNWGSEVTGGPTPTYADRMTGCFWDYVRVFTPQGSRIIDYTANDLPGDWFPAHGNPYPTQIDPWIDGTYNGFGIMTITPPSETSEVQFRYDLPENVITDENGRQVYRLYFQKQAGALAPQLRIEVQLPADAVIESVSPTSIENQNGLIVFEMRPEADQQFEIVFQ